MTTDNLLQSFPELLEIQSELFSTLDLEYLLQTLENNPPEIADQILIDWYQARQPIKKALRMLAKSREIEKVPPSQASQSARITELSQKVKEKLSERTDSTKSDSAQPDKNQNND